MRTRILPQDAPTAAPDAGAHRPNYLVIGAQRGGSTWIWSQLRKHPQFFVAPTKELEFFSYRKNLNDERWQQYLAHFAPGAAHHWRGECTPSYFMSVNEDSPWYSRISGFNQNIPASIRDYLGPDVRLVLSLRHPVERAVSAFFHHAAMGRIGGGANIFSAGRDHAIIDAGFYARHLKVWLKYFPIEQFFICTTYQIEQSPTDTLDRLRRFFGRELLPFQDPEPPLNQGARRVSIGGRLVPLRRLLSGPSVRAGDVRRLEEIYAADIEELERLLRQPLFTPWYRPPIS